MKQYLKREDGKNLGYIKIGNGPGLLIVHGTFRQASNYLKMAEYLKANYTVYIMERRGRNESEYNGDYTIEQANSDIDLMVKSFNIKYIFGHSFGAVNTLAYSLNNELEKIIVFEPVKLNLMNLSWLERFGKGLNSNNLASAFLIFLKGMEMGGNIEKIPNFIPLTLLKLALLNKKVKNSFSLLKTVPNDFKCIETFEITNPNYSTIDNEVLLISTSKTPNYIKESCKEFENKLHNTKHITLEGIGHNGPDEEDPKLVADVVLKYLKK